MYSIQRSFLTGVAAFAALIPSALGQSFQEPPALFVSDAGLQQVKDRVAEGEAPYKTAYDTFIGVTSSYLDDAPDPFYMADIKTIEFGWCNSPGEPDDSLKDLTTKLTDESNKARNLAIAYLLTGDARFANKAKAFALAWVDHSTLVNFYDFNIDFRNSTFDGKEDGFCNNSWNMALDSMWQAYGLINFSDTYAILSRQGALSAAEDERLSNWLRNELFPATNAGFHAWTRWADTHPNSGSYTRYRSDNHLSWALAGLGAAAAALEDEGMWNYVYEGGEYDDGRSGPYANPSNVRAQIGRAIAADGEVYDQRVRAGEHKGLNYGFFSLWALTLTAQIAETAKGEDYWNVVGSRGGSIVTALDHYGRYAAGDIPPFDPEETTDPTFFRFIFEMPVGNQWVTGDRLDLYVRARDSKPRAQLVKQSIGPVTLLTGDLPEPGAAVPKAPSDLRVFE